MIDIDGLRLVSYAIPATKRATAATSATVDCSGAHELLVVHVHGKDSNSSAVLIRHCSASTTLFASATAFSTPVTAAIATSAAQAFIVRRQPGLKKCLAIKLSTTAASANNGVLVFSMRNRSEPYSSTLGAFSAVTTMTV